MSGVLRADDIVVSGTSRFGLSVGGSARAQLSRARFDGLGIRAEDQSQLELRTSVVVGGPVGLVVDRGAKAQLRAVAFEANTEFGFIVRGGGSELDVDQVVGRGGGGAGMSNGAALDGGKLTGRRLAFMGNAWYGLSAGAGGIIELQDLLVRDTTPRAETPRLGMALSVSDGSMVTVLRAHWVRCMGYGAIVKNSVADFEDRDRDRCPRSLGFKS
jgi:hypothetical protein